MTGLWCLFFFVVLGSLAYNQASRWVYALGLGAYLLAYTVLAGLGLFAAVWWWLVYAVVFSFVLILPLRRSLLARPIFAIYKKMKPRMSATEREALCAGDADWTQALFSGRPDWAAFRTSPYSQLTEDERAFLNGPVEQVCAMANDWEISQTMTVPSAVWDFLKQERFFSMIIPTEYGGRGLSAVAQSAVLSRLSSCSTALAVIASVPNSLGPGELLLHYGTEEQKSYYLPRLAVGEEIPCFALTSPVAGSDAGSIVDYGEVCQAEFDGKQQLCIRLTWDKRYITLAPVATLLGLAFKLFDPHKLLGNKTELGITCALIPTSTPGVSIGRRHNPVGCAFPNGPTHGKDVLIPIDWIIGGQKMAGQGWRMLMECLAAGRGVSLPSVVSGGAAKMALASSAYARIRSQFNVPIGQFPGVQEVLVQAMAYGYLVQAIRLFTASMIDQGTRPVVASAVAKYTATEYARKVVMASMDLHGGKGICMGPTNYITQTYFEVPVGITVEGANILTRSMMIFGQGAIRSHPYVLEELLAADEPNPAAGLARFDKAFFAHMGFLFGNHVRAIVLGVTNAFFVKVPFSTPLRRYYQILTRFSTILALVADVCMITVGAELKRKENLSGRLADLVNTLYCAACVLKHYEHGNAGQGQEEELSLVRWLCLDLLKHFQRQLHELLINLPNRWVAAYLRIVCLPVGRFLRKPSDRLAEAVCKESMTQSPLRERYKDFIAGFDRDDSLVSQLEATFSAVLAAEKLEKKLKLAVKNGKISGLSFADLVADGVRQAVVSEAEAEQLLTMDAMRMSIIKVDDFAADDVARGY